MKITNQDPDFDTYLSYIFRQMTALMSKTLPKKVINVNIQLRKMNMSLLLKSPI